MGLMESFFNKGPTLYMDNYNASEPLFEDLEERGTLASGTVRSNRKGLPRDITDAQTEQIKGLKWGESVDRQKSTIKCVGWKDTKMVYMVATTPVSPTSNSEVERSIKAGNKWQKTVVTQPSIISDYNKNMGGVDLWSLALQMPKSL